MISVQLSINAVDYSSNLLGTVRIAAKEGEARIAEFTLNPSAGALNPYDWIGKAVTIDFTDGATTRIFTGIVHLPTYDISSGLTSFVCTDNLQEVFETTDRATINSLIPGRWDDAVFNDPDENWTYAQQRISCYPGAFDKSAAGALRSTAWLAKLTPDYTYTDSSILENTLGIGLAERRNITNSIKINFSSRYERLWQRELSATWASGFNNGAGDLGFYIYLANPTELPTKTMVTNAFSQYALKNISFVDLPGSGFYGTTSPIGFVASDWGRELCLDATATVAARWKQTVTDNYTITIKSDASVAAHGLIEIERNHAAVSTPDISFTDFKTYAAPTGSLIETGNYIATNEQSISNAILCAMEQAKVEILKRHRSNSVQFSIAINPALDVTHTIRCNHAKLQATGKVYAFNHTIDLVKGSAVSEIVLAIFLPNVASQTDDAITQPASPYVSPSSLPNTLPALDSHYGNIDGAPVQDPDWNGWVANYFTWAGTPPAPEYYDTGYTVEFSAITDADAVEFNGTHSFNIAIPQDELVIIK